VLRPSSTPGASVKRTENRWRMEIPAGRLGAYRLAQLDDYATLSRRDFHHSTPTNIHLEARVSGSGLPGTWGFGLWNDPFGFSFGFGGTPGRIPVLPTACWFFHASPPNWLAFRDRIPARGFFAGTTHSPRLPSLLLAPSLLITPLLILRPLSRLIRRLGSLIVQQEAVAIPETVTEWHQYSIVWLREGVEFGVDGRTILKTSIGLASPLGLVIWIDNQYAAWTPEGRLAYGTLDNPAAWLEIRELEVNG
jgi:hypothetical protein